jgi:hypothetical protein
MIWCNSLVVNISCKIETIIVANTAHCNQKYLIKIIFKITFIIDDIHIIKALNFAFPNHATIEWLIDNNTFNNSKIDQIRKSFHDSIKFIQ